MTQVHKQAEVPETVEEFYRQEGVANMSEAERDAHYQTIMDEAAQHTDETGMVAWQDPTSLAIIPGMQIAHNLPVAEKTRLLATVTSFTGAPSEGVDEYLGMPIPVTGVVIHPVSVRSRQSVIDEETGEELYPLVPDFRTVFKRRDSSKTLSFVAKSVRSFAETYLIPVFGIGDWGFTVMLRFVQVPTRAGRAYNVQIVDAPQPEEQTGKGRK